jgi:2',3'-cyclic-nucleotide 2'-phosphodiesterase (5'-nucleotidase family)
MATEVGDTILLGGGYHYTAYAKARLSYDRRAGRLIQTSFGVNANDAGDPDAGLTGIVERWKARFEGLLSEVIAWSSSAIDHTSDDFRQAVVDSWLWADPSADVAITNVGGLRTPLPAGAITLNDLINTMPFENNIIAVNVTGAVLLQAVAEGGRPIVAGMRREGDLWIVDGTGLAIDPDQEYRVLVNSFMYDGGDNFHALAGYDPEGFDTGTNYRQPLVDWLRSLQSSPASPLSLTDLP